MKKHYLVVAAGILLLAAGAFAQEAQTPTPQNTQEIKDAKYTNESIARLSFVEGKGFVQRASDLGYEEAALNMPISEGDRIGTSEGRLEVHFGKGNYIRLDDDTKVDILNLPKKDDDIARIRVWSGRVYLVVGSLKKEKGIELHTADSSFYVLERGVYRVNVRENRNTEIQVYQGLIEVAGEEGSTLLKASQKLEIAEGRFASKPSSFIAVANDGFDRFNESRTSATTREVAQSRLPEDLSDYETVLDENGEWTYLPPYGNVWRPNDVDDDWRPYYDGRWTWLPLSGWTWWPYEPWGWPTFHYGRWHWGVDFGWYWIPMNMWGPAWVNWWWDDWYFGWAPLSYWGYPGVWLGGSYYGHYYGQYYPVGSRALTVVRRDQLRDPHIARNALRGDALKSINRISLTNRSLTLKPAGTKISVQPIDGGRVLLRNNGGGSGLTSDRRINRPGTATGGPANSTGPRAIRKPEDPGKSAGTGKGTTAKPQSVRSPSSGKKSGSTGKSSGSGGRTIRKKDGTPATSESAAAGYRSDPNITGPGTSSRVGSPRNANGYPSSPTIRRPQSSPSYGASGRTRTGTSAGPYSRPSSSSGRSIRSSGSGTGSSSAGRSGSVSRGSSSSGRSGSVSRGSSSRSSGSASRGSSSRGSSGGSRGSSGGSRGSSGGGVRRK
ncbi:MAG TPA: DUF6600 domain-containing protein [Acidobacteriota bacterium]|nr:DUF6600 domain-containing protein [Acidobacteriota bacterium]